MSVRRGARDDRIYSDRLTLHTLIEIFRLVEFVSDVFDSMVFTRLVRVRRPRRSLYTNPKPALKSGTRNL